MTKIKQSTKKPAQHSTTWVSLMKPMLGERSRIHKCKYCMTPFTTVQNKGKTGKIGLILETEIRITLCGMEVC